MFDRIEHFIKTRLVSKKILIGLSGGPDSVFLTYALNYFKDENSFSIHLVHINYNLRRVESDQDEQFCRELADHLNVPIDVKRVDLSDLKHTPGNIQAEARKIRIDFFYELLEKYSFDAIALGHTKDDNVETILANIFRGCSLDGLSGVTEISGKIIRPLLNIKKAQILEYLQKNKLAFREDRSNRENDYSRNKIRNIVLPEIKSNLNPKVDEAILRLAEQAGDIERYLSESAEEFIRYNCQKSLFNNILVDLESLKKIPDVLKKYVIKTCLTRLAENPRDILNYGLLSKSLNILDDKTGTRADLGGGLMIEKADRSLIIFKPNNSPRSIKIELPGNIVLDDFNIMLHSEKVSPDDVNNTLKESDNFKVVIDFKALSSDLYLRYFKAGDTIRPLGMKHSRKLSDLFIDRKIPRALRKEIPILVSGGEIVWIVGVMISDKFKIKPSTSVAMKLWIEKLV